MIFSIITSCFNSTKTLYRTFDCLSSLKSKDFEWILIDDCSTDDGATKSMITSIADEAKFPVKYKFLEKNHFGARSTYEACLLAEGRYCCILDHDDELTVDSLDIVSSYLDLLSDDSVAGLTGRCNDRSNRLIGKKFPQSVFVGREGIVRFKWGVVDELFQFTKTEVLLQYFKEMQPGYTNGYVWAKISKSYDYIFIDRVLRLYDTDLPTSYSNTKKLHVVYPHAKARALEETLVCYNDYLFYNFLYSIRLAGSCVRHRFNANLSILSGLPSGFSSKLFYVIAIPLGWLKSKRII